MAKPRGCSRRIDGLRCCLESVPRRTSILEAYRVTYNTRYISGQGIPSYRPRYSNSKN